MTQTFNHDTDNSNQAFPDTAPEETSVSPEVVPIVPPLRSKMQEKIPVIQQLSLLAAILILLLGGALSPKIFTFFQNGQEQIPASPIEAQQPIVQPQTTSQKEPFSDITITAESAFVWDIQEQRALYRKDASKQLPLASVTKLMTTLLAQELLQENAKVTISDTAIRQDGDSGLLMDEIFQRQKLSDLVLMSSSNDGAYALAASAGTLIEKKDPANAFVNAMNIRAQELGLKNTYFKNPTGLDLSADEAGAYGTAKDISFLMEYIILNQPDILTSTREDSERIYSQDGIYHDASNTNYYIDKIPGLIGSKTGYTDLAGGNLVVAFDAGLNRPIVVTVLASTRQARFTDVLTLVEEAQKYVTKNK